jgi:hypothetical protein
LTRKALLLGLDIYYDSKLRLEAPANDVAEIAETLALIGYQSIDVTKCLSSAGRPLTTSEIRQHIRQFLKENTNGQELLIYVSAHGIDQDGQRLIVPVDYYSDDAQPPSALVGDQWLFGLARDSLAHSVIIVLDTCREGVKFVLGEDTVDKGPSASSSAGPPILRPGPDSPTVAIVYSCRGGQRSFATSGSKAISYFTSALCHVLKTDDNVSTLEDVVTRAYIRLSEILPTGRRQEPFID